MCKYEGNVTLKIHGCHLETEWEVQEVPSTCPGERSLEMPMEEVGPLLPWLLTQTMAPLLENWRTAPTRPQGTLFLPPKDFLSSERHRDSTWGPLCPRDPTEVRHPPGSPLTLLHHL